MRAHRRDPPQRVRGQHPRHVLDGVHDTSTLNDFARASECDPGYRRAVRFAVLAFVCAACAPAVDGPTERQRVVDRAVADRVTAQLTALPGVVRAEVILHRAVADPLAVAPAAAATASLVVIVDDRADRARLAVHARSLARAAAPEIEPTIVIEVGATRAELATVGPFTVETGSKRALKATLVFALAAIAALAAWIAWCYRRGSSAQ
jgi:hypothetical protein